MESSVSVTTSHAGDMVGYRAQDQTMGHVSVEHVNAEWDGQVKLVSAQTTDTTVTPVILLKNVWAEDYVNVESASVKKTIQGNTVKSVR
jgi:hypothetical protein